MFQQEPIKIIAHTSYYSIILTLQNYRIQTHEHSEINNMDIKGVKPGLTLYYNYPIMPLMSAYASGITNRISVRPEIRFRPLFQIRFRFRPNIGRIWPNFNLSF